MSTALHSPVKGVVKKVGDFRGVDGRFAPAIAIEADPFATQEVDPDAAPDWRSLSLEAFIEAVQMAGVVGMGGVETGRFFSEFFELPADAWSGFLSGQLPPAELDAAIDGGDTSRSSPTPSVCRPQPVDLATREWRMSPTIATVRFSNCFLC